MLGFKGDNKVMSARTVFFISDGTAITAEQLGRSILSQFSGVKFETRVLPYIDSEERAQTAVAIINDASEKDGAPAFVFDTLVSPQLREIINSANACNLDMYEGLISRISHELGMPPDPHKGFAHDAVDSETYKSRIDAVHYALDNDDGARTRHYDKADIILLGVSRSGKTPTSIYLALRFGIRAANYPITEEDVEFGGLPKVLKEHKGRLFGLMIDVDRLVAIRTERKAGTRYASRAQCERELAAIQDMYRMNGIPSLDVSEMSIEEIATRILQITGMKRRIG